MTGESLKKSATFGAFLYLPHQFGQISTNRQDPTHCIIKRLNNLAWATAFPFALRKHETPLPSLHIERLRPLSGIETPIQAHFLPVSR